MTINSRVIAVDPFAYITPYDDLRYAPILAASTFPASTVEVSMLLSYLLSKHWEVGIKDPELIWGKVVLESKAEVDPIDEFPKLNQRTQYFIDRTALLEAGIDFSDYVKRLELVGYKMIPKPEPKQCSKCLRSDVATLNKRWFLNWNEAERQLSTYIDTLFLIGEREQINHFQYDLVFGNQFGDILTDILIAKERPAGIGPAFDSVIIPMLGVAASNSVARPISELEYAAVWDEVYKVGIILEHLVHAGKPLQALPREGVEAMKYMFSEVLFSPMDVYKLAAITKNVEFPVAVATENLVAMDELIKEEWLIPYTRVMITAPLEGAIVVAYTPSGIPFKVIWVPPGTYTTIDLIPGTVLFYVAPYENGHSKYFTERHTYEYKKGDRAINLIVYGEVVPVLPDGYLIPYGKDYWAHGCFGLFLSTRSLPLVEYVAYLEEGRLPTELGQYDVNYEAYYLTALTEIGSLGYVFYRG